MGLKIKSIMSIGKIVLGTLAGVAIGAIAGVLFAPGKGSETRRQIKDKSDGYMDSVQSKFDGMVDSVTEKFQSTKNDVENLAEKGKNKYKNFKNDVAADINHATS